jgi:hypothetical protein
VKEKEAGGGDVVKQTGQPLLVMVLRLVSL